MYRLRDNHQSAYRTGRSAKTVLPKVHQDITEAPDNTSIAALVLAELSAAFDVSDHAILQKHLKCSFGVTGCALSWIQPYFGGRIKCITLGASTSEVGAWNSVSHKDRLLSHVSYV